MKYYLKSKPVSWDINICQVLSGIWVWVHDIMIIFLRQSKSSYFHESDFGSFILLAMIYMKLGKSWKLHCSIETKMNNQVCSHDKIYEKKPILYHYWKWENFVYRQTLFFIVFNFIHIREVYETLLKRFPFLLIYNMLRKREREREREILAWTYGNL